MQALERVHPTKPTRPGQAEKIEFEYKRHGTLCLIANFIVATGKVIEPTIGPTRNEDDFVDHIRRTVDSDPGANWIFIADQLNTHMSEGLVRLVAERCAIGEDLGGKRKDGVLHSMQSRKEFLEDPTHKIRFVFTPKHCSWMNQIEIWFSILVRRVLRRGSFATIDHLRERILDFIRYFNNVLAKPFKWTFTGRPLQAR
jgi:hypothetical protein